MKLYYSPGACSLASHIILTEIGKPFSVEKVDLKAKVTASGADYRAINPKGSVPALQLDDKQVLTEGVAIMQYVCDLAGAETLAPKCGTLPRARLAEMLNFITSEVHKSYSPLFRPGMSDEAKSAQRELINTKLAVLEQQLADGRPYLLGKDFTCADAYAFVVVNWSGGTGVSLDRLPKLSAFQKRVAERPATQAAMKAEGMLR